MEFTVIPPAFGDPDFFTLEHEGKGWFMGSYDDRIGSTSDIASLDDMRAKL